MSSSDPMCPKFKKLKEEQKGSRKTKPLLGSKEAGTRTVANGKRVANFCAGPGAVSDQVLLNLQHELLSFESSGMVSEEKTHTHTRIGPVFLFSIPWAVDDPFLTRMTFFPSTHEMN